MESKKKYDSPLMIIALLLLLISPTSFFNGIKDLFPSSFTFQTIIQIIKYLSPTIFVLYWIKSNNISFESIGITIKINWKFELLVVVPMLTICLGLVHLPLLFFNDYFQPYFLNIKPEVYNYLFPEQNKNLIEPIWLIAVLHSLTYIVTVCYEEIIMRGIFITFLRKLFNNTILAILISAVIFGSYHLYQDQVDAVKNILIGFVYGSFFVWRKNLFACILLHYIHDFSNVIMKVW